jgi:hypothetical protein
MPGLYDLDTCFQAIIHFEVLNALVRGLHENQMSQSSFTSRTNRACFRDFTGLYLHEHLVRAAVTAEPSPCHPCRGDSRTVPMSPPHVTSMSPSAELTRENHPYVTHALPSKVTQLTVTLGYVSYSRFSKWLDFCYHYQRFMCLTIVSKGSFHGFLCKLR